MAKTIDNLTKMFSSGAESTIRYLAFAEAADREGHLGVAKIFRTVAKAKMFHALSHFRAAKKVDTTLENLKQAREEESYDYQSACPVMVKDATAEGALEARHSLEYAMSIGPIITRLIGKAIGNPDLARRERLLRLSGMRAISNSEQRPINARIAGWTAVASWRFN